MKRFRVIFCSALCIISLIVGCTSENKDIPSEEIIIEEKQDIKTESSSDSAEPVPTITRPVSSDFVFPDTDTGEIPLIFSHGGAPCDIGALVYFTKHPNINLIGMVLSDGEIHPENALDDWPAFLIDVIEHKSAAIGLGTEKAIDPNAHKFPAPWREVADTFWGLALPSKKTDFEITLGHELIIELINNSPEKVTIIGMASMVDIAIALQQDPGIIDNIAQVIIMGGAFTIKGNLDEGPEPTTNEVAEWNIWVDPIAADYLFNSGVPLTIVPLDAIQYLVQNDKVKQMNSITDPGVNYVAQMWNNQIGWAPEGFFIWDTIAAVAVTNPEYFSWTHDGVDVITEVGDFQGQTIALNNGARHTRFATDADYDAILNQVFDVFEFVTLEDFVSESESEDLKSDSFMIELGGVWEGVATSGFLITFDLDSPCKLNEICGSFEIPDFSLNGEIVFTEVKGNEYIFQATNLSSGQTGNPYESLTRLDDGTLKYFTTDYTTENEAILMKK